MSVFERAGYLLSRIFLERKNKMGTQNEVKRGKNMMFSDSSLSSVKD